MTTALPLVPRLFDGPTGDPHLPAQRRAATRVLDRLTVLAPERTSEIAERVQAAERASTRQERGSGREAQQREALLAWRDVHAAAHAAVRSALADRAAAAARWQRLEPLVQASVDGARERVETGALAFDAGRALTEAQYLLERARALADAGRLDDALATGEQARDTASRVEDAWQRSHGRFEDAEELARWQRAVRETIAASRGGRVALVVDKLNRRLYVLSDGAVLESFDVELGARGLYRKLHTGDRATPEGRYRVTVVKTGSDTRFYKALLIDYPSDEDRRRYRRAVGRGEAPPAIGPGSLIEIHGHGGRGYDWTDGCVALTDGDMDRLLPRVRAGTTVTIVGTIPPGTLPEGSRP